MRIRKIIIYIFLFLFLSVEQSQDITPVLASRGYITSATIFKEPVSTPTIIPTITPTAIIKNDNIPDGKYDYGCEPSDGIECVNPSMSFDEQVAHVLFKEGSSDGLQLLVDMLQVMDNRAVNAWECSIYDCGVEELHSLNPQKIPWSEITDEQAERLILYILSAPYTSRGETHPAWNGWSQPLEMKKIVELYPRKLKNYEYTLKAVKEWRENCIGYNHEDGNDTCIFLELDNGKVLRPQHAICAQNVLYVYMTQDRLLSRFAPVVAYDKLDYGDFVVYVQFLTLNGYQFDSLR